MLTNRTNHRRDTISHRLLKEATMQKWINALLIAFLLATTLLTPGVAHAQDDAAQQKMAAIKQSLQTSTQALRGYEWIETVTV